MKIFKYPLEVTDHQSVQMVCGADILSVGVDSHGRLCAWAMVNPGQTKHARDIWIIGTGNPMPEVPLRFLGSVTMAPFVWHIFEGL